MKGYDVLYQAKLEQLALAALVETSIGRAFALKHHTVGRLGIAPWFCAFQRPLERVW